VETVAVPQPPGSVMICEALVRMPAGVAVATVGCSADADQALPYGPTEGGPGGILGRKAGVENPPPAPYKRYRFIHITTEVGGVSGHAGHTYAREGKLVRDTKRPATIASRQLLHSEAKGEKLGQ